MNQHEDYSACGVPRQFDDPFLLPSSGSMPTNIFNALHWCRFLYFLNPQYRQASARVVRHFITDFDYPGTSDTKEQEEQDELLKEKLKLPLALAEMGDEWSMSGNAFYRIHFPFDRDLITPDGKSYSLSIFSDAKFHLTSMTYEVTLPDTRQKVKLPFRDFPSRDKDRIRLRKIDPLYITVQHNIISGSNRYIYRFEQQIVSDVKKGKRHVVDDIPQAMLAAMQKGQDFLFNDGQIYHFMAPTVSGVQNAGYGLPNVFANYRSLYQLQVYRKIDEAIGLDYMVPFRIFTPGQTTTGSDSMVNNMLLPRWANEVGRIIDHRRRDKFAIHAMPFPVTYNEYGANGKELTPKDMMEYQTNSMLDGMGYPAELFRGTLQYLQVPTAMRLFENTFMFINIGFNEFTQWVSKRVRAYLGLPAIKVVLQKPAMADSLERKQILLQLMSTGEISRETGLDQLGIENPVDEVIKRVEEDIEIERRKTKMTADFQKEMETGIAASGEGGAAASGGVTPTDIQQKAQDMAQYWLEIPEDGVRRNAMQATKQSDPQLYSMAKQVMEEMRSQGASQGRAQAGQPPQQ